MVVVCAVKVGVEVLIVSVVSLVFSSSSVVVDDDDDSRNSRIAGKDVVGRWSSLVENEVMVGLDSWLL